MECEYIVMSKEKKIQLESPSYASYSESDREAFLSQLGNFTPYQRTVFHTLCKAQNGAVRYKTFADRISLQIKNVHSEIDALVKKLNVHRLALFLYSYETSGKEVQKKKEYIILTDQGDQSFYRFSMQQLFEDITAGSTPRLPTGKVLEEFNISIPDYMISEISRENLRKPYIQDIFITPSILSFQVKNDEHIYFLSSQLNQLIQLCIQVIRDYTQSNSILSELARFKNTSITNLKQNLATRTPLTWMDLSKTIIEFDGKRSQQQFTIGDSFCQAAEMVYTYLKNEIADAKQKQEQEQELESDLQKIVEKLKKKYFEPISQERLNNELDTLKEKYGDRYQEVKDQFFERYSKLKEATKLPHVVFIGKSYIHRTHLHKYVAYRFKELSAEMEEQYINLMKRLLRTSNRNEDATFFSKKNFNVDIERRIREADRFIAELLERPRILAEAIIYVAKEEKQIKDIDQVKHVLEQYFLPGTMQYKQISEICNLNIFIIFQKAFTDLPALRQFWMKITGKFRAYRDKYTQFRPKLPVALSGVVETTDVENSERTRSPEERREREPVHSSSERSSPHRTVPSRRRKGVQNVKKRDKQYSHRQTEEAWDDFRDSLKK